ncbi:hypothetical protein E2P81_ATG09922 [Venturia nashicola]|uniref:Uncharacterized protein n=1 Tax=Venturia nashicola TaxID=86259 RepID=A0A4Z1NK71_9PEZI|nr:hypothetical protein E6O75_ATG10140 [Venturia nashicola]TLD15074.1 hypothetical protein E2P81_ATG09922 [Venturia nashicola]
MSPSNQNKNTEKIAKKENGTSTNSNSTQNNFKASGSVAAKSVEEVQEERIERMVTSCRRIWGSYTDFDLDCRWVEQDGIQGWSVQMRKSYGDRVGAQEMWTLVKATEEEAWLDMEELLND